MTAEATAGTTPVPGGVLAAQTLAVHDVDTVFTLSGGHLLPLYDGACRPASASSTPATSRAPTFAAEGWAKVTRRLGVRGAHRRAGRHQRRERDDGGVDERLAGGRARRARAAGAVGSGLAAGARPRPDRRVRDQARRDRRPGASIVTEVDAACRAARTPHRGPTFVDIPLDAFGPGRRPRYPQPPTRRRSRGPSPIPTTVARVAKLVAGARSRRCSWSGGDVYWAGAEAEMRAFVEAARVPAFVNGMGRGTLPADHELAFARARSVALKRADLVLVAGTPLDFRLGFGRFGDARVVHLCDARERDRPAHASSPASAGGDLRAVLATLAESVASQTSAGTFTERRAGSRSSATTSRRSGRRSSQASRPTRRRSTRPASTASCARGSTATRS